MTESRTENRTSTALTPVELATAAVMSSFAVALSVVAMVVPLATALQIVAAVPMAVVAQRHRTRVLVSAAVAGTLVAFVAAGWSTAITVATAALLGGMVGRAKRLGHGLFRVLVTSAVVGPAIGLVTVAVLFVLAPLRELFLKTIENTIEGVARLMSRTEILIPAADTLRSGVGAVLDNWWWWILGTAIFSIVVGVFFTWLILGAILDRLSTIPVADHLPAAVDGVVAPLPVRLNNVGFSYDGSRTAALQGLDLTIDFGEFVAVVGHNGSGKSTLTRILAGRTPTTGTVDRPGVAGLGLAGGTAVVLQRPESQILGSRVGDDVVWGLPADAETDIDALLTEVGLGGMGARDTSTLSGGEMQRLAVAAALARRPALLIADEATTMVDAAGRASLVALLADLPTRHRMSVVLVTHQELETAAADRVVHLHGGTQVQHSAEWMRTAFLDRATTHFRAGPPIMTLRGVGHTYNRRTPWSQLALTGIDLTVHAGDGLLVLGGNGSGKSTLAWILAGLTKPSTGTADFEGSPVSDKIGVVGLAFQHSRLQLQRRTVAEDIAAAGGPEVGSVHVSRAMDAVGLDRLLAGREIDSLSGGQMRRVVIAGLVVNKPRVLVLDEPLAGLDPPGRTDIIGVLGQLRRQGIAIIVISHDIDGIDSVCDRTITLAGGRITSETTTRGVPS
ncbi:MULTISPECIES: ABC transporter ATP-binding protein [unclassified Rhodococcus (in: high G+C Gram-positive bacteria)]|uniref:ABC transporter ATP-binding protein n=1 Tax=unclassified Rhodococcus (in: high G+C Gram-positive bacteria) TaxID=192944 RepID=UPI001FF7491A|nr:MULTISPECIES: ABC transporter ATP-binding protein [unclassified Rhodococcus (in: high G+C Gram-positive bacteria)]